MDAFENVQTDLGTSPPPPLSPAPSYTSLWTPMSPVQAHPHRCPVSRHDTAFERAKSVNRVSCKVDASGTRLGGALLQDGHALDFTSSTLSATEVHFMLPLAIEEACTKFYQYL